MEDEYVSVDIEGPKKIGDKFRQIGACDVHSRTVKFLVTFFEWGPDGEIINEKISQEAGVRKFAVWLDTHFRRAVCVTWNSWDYVHIKAAFDRYNIPSPFGEPGRSLDIKVYYMGLMKKPYRETGKREVCKLFPSVQKHAHNGLLDAVEQAEIFAQMLGWRWDQRDWTYRVDNLQ